MKKSMPKIIFIILIIILIIAIIIAIIGQKEKNMTKKIYKDICEKNSYTFSMTEQDIDYTLTVSKKDKLISIDTLSENDHMTTLVDEEAAYYIMHSEKQYYLYDGEEIDANIVKNGLSEIEKQEYISGNEKINGNNYYYEEYDGITTFIIWLEYLEEDNIKTRFYYDKGKIAYIKTIIGEEEELLKVNFTESVDDSLFEIPDDYVEL